MATEDKGTMIGWRSRAALAVHLSVIVALACESATAPNKGGGREVRPPIQMIGAGFTGALDLGGGFGMGVLIPEPAPVPGYEDVLPIDLTTASGDRERLLLRRAWDENDRSLYMITVFMDPGAEIRSPELIARLPDIGGVLVLGAQNWSNGSYMTAISAEWAIEIVESWPHVRQADHTYGARSDPSDPLNRLMAGALSAHLSQSKSRANGTLELSPTDTVVIAYEAEDGQLHSHAVEWPSNASVASEISFSPRLTTR